MALIRSIRLERKPPDAPFLVIKNPIIWLTGEGAAEGAQNAKGPIPSQEAESGYR